MLYPLVSPRIPRSAVPLRVLSAEAFKGWAKKQTATVRAWLKAQGFAAKPGCWALIPGRDGSLARVVAIVGERPGLWDLAALPKSLPKGSYALEAFDDRATTAKWALGWLLGGYRFDLYKKDEKPNATLCLSKEIDYDNIRDRAEALAMTRDLIAMPAEDFGPAQLATVVKDVGKAFGAKVKEIVGDDLLKHNYPAIHLVGRASPKERAPRLIDLTWGNPNDPYVTLVGKGVCFDTGGLDIKTSGGMSLMRKDKAGAAAALGVARLIMARKLPVRLRLLIPALENAVAGNAFRPSDIVKMRSGLTVEIGNTDAEGRLVVGDALAEAVAESPDLLFDFTTLTGAARAVMGTEITAFTSNCEALATELYEAGEVWQDPLCRLPLYDGYESMIGSSFADVISSAASSYAQTITAALFLQHFVPKTQCWAHLDFMGYTLSAKPGRPEGGSDMTVRAVFGMLEKRFPPR